MDSDGRVFHYRDDAVDYFITSEQPVTELTEDNLEQCERCKGWSVSAADHLDGAINGMGGLMDGKDGISLWYQETYGLHRLCRECEDELEDEYQEHLKGERNNGS